MKLHLSYVDTYAGCMPPICSVPATRPTRCMPTICSVPTTPPAGCMPFICTALPQSQQQLTDMRNQQDSSPTSCFPSCPTNPSQRRSQSPHHRRSASPNRGPRHPIRPSILIDNQVFNQAQVEMCFPPAPYAWGTTHTESSNATPLPLGTDNINPPPSTYMANCSSPKTTSLSVPIGN